MQNRNILLLIELPPPMHGMTYINKIIYDDINKDPNILVFKLEYGGNIDDIGKKSIYRILKNLISMLGVWSVFLLHRPNTVYSVLSATNFGIVRDFLNLLPVVVFGIKKTLHLHGFTYFDIYHKSKIYRTIFDILKKNSKFIVLCDKQKKIADGLFGINSFILPNCLRENAKAKRRDKHNEYLKLLYIGNISKAKGVFDLVKAVCLMDNVKLTIAGQVWTDSKEFELLMQNNAEKVNFVGFADENLKRELFASHDIFCLPSNLEEGSPISIIEAMSFGMPILASNKGCVPDMILRCGFVFEAPISSDILDNAITYITSNYEKLSAASLREYEGKYSREVFIKNFKELLCVRY